MAQSPTRWFSVRCLFEVQPGDHDTGLDRTFEERVTLWHAGTLDEAIELAEAEAGEYGQGVDLRYLGLAQAYALDGEPGHGVEVFSLLRASRLEPRVYLDTFFDTGSEYQHR